MKKFFNEFKEFISKGNVIDLAVGVIIGGSFGSIVTSLVENIIMPLVGILIGGYNFSELKIKIKDSEILYGKFIQNVVDFLIVAFCIFIFIKLINRLKKPKPAPVKEEPKKTDEVILLEEIRDLLKKDKIENKKGKNIKRIKA